MSIDTGANRDRLTDPVEIAETLIALYVQRGDRRYGESVSQTEHAIQSGAYAMASGSTDAGILAAFFHDIGHLLEGGTDTDLPGGADRFHEDLGADFLAGFFDEEVTTPVRLHVAAKRYLCAVEPSYLDGLSLASVRSLAIQGGPMTAGERADFEATPGAMPALDLRRWDDRAKVAGAPAPPLEVFRDLVVDVLRAHTAPDQHHP